MYLRIYFFCRSYNQLARNFHHFCKTEFFPGALPFFADTVLALALSKKEIINNKLIKIFSSVFANFLESRTHRFIAIAEGIKQTLAFFIGLIQIRSNGCNSTGNFNSVICHNPFEHIKLFLFSKFVAVGFKIDFVYSNIFLQPFSLLAQIFFCNMIYPSGNAVGYGLKVFVMHAITPIKKL